MTGLGMDGAPGPTLGTIHRGEQIVHLPCRCGHYGETHTHNRPGTDCARHGCWCAMYRPASGQSGGAS